MYDISVFAKFSSGRDKTHVHLQSPCLKHIIFNLDVLLYHGTWSTEPDLFNGTTNSSLYDCKKLY